MAKPVYVPVEIGLDRKGKITVTPDPFWVSKRKKHRVVWLCTVEHEHTGGSPCFKVEFNKNGSPFNGHQFHGHGASSGRATVRANRKKLYKYTVTINGNNLDPGGGVRA